MVDWMKQIAAPSTTTADIFAGDVLNYLMQYHDDTDLAAGDPNGIARIATETVFRTGKFKISDLDNSNSITIAVPNYVENKIVNLPTTLGTSDEIVVEDAVQTMTFKTLSVDLNTLKHSTTNAAGDLLKGNGTGFIRFPRGAANQILSVNTGGTDVAWSDPITTSILLPDLASSGSIWGVWTGGARDGTGLFANCKPLGTISSRSDTTTSGQTTTNFATSATITTFAGFTGWDTTVAGLATQRNQNFRFKTKFQTDDITNHRFAIGFAAVGVLPSGVDAFLATATAGFLFRYSSTTDTTIKLLRNDAAGSPVQVDTGVTLANNVPVTLEIIADEANTRMGWAINGGSVTYYTTDIPDGTTSLNYHFRDENKTAVIKRLDMYYAYLIQKSVP